MKGNFFGKKINTSRTAEQFGNGQHSTTTQAALAAGMSSHDGSGSTATHHRLAKALMLGGVMSALAAGSAMAAGWEFDGDTWHYVDNYGYYVTDTWEKSGDSYFYLDSNGDMVTSTVIEDGENYYYVDSSGARVTNSWKAVAKDDYDDNFEDAEYYWMYFGSDGKAYTDSTSPETINGNKYMFDSEGHMMYGFVDANGDMLTSGDASDVYDSQWYFGGWNDGAMKTGWVDVTAYLTDEEDYEDNDSNWVYYKSGGKRATDTTMTINGYKYTFDSNGIMISGWKDTEVASTSTASASTTYTYYTESGSMKKNTWVYAIPDESVNQDDYDDGTYRWFYANSSGALITNDAKKISGKWYYFGSDGIMVSGLVHLNDDTISSATEVVTDFDMDEVTGDEIKSLDLSDGSGLYYFGADDSDGAMKKSATVKLELEDDTYTFYFDANGNAYNGLKSSKYYQNGILLTADSDDGYEVIEVVSASDATDGTAKYVLVSDTGAVKTSGTVKDDNGNYYAIHDGKIGFFREDDLASKAASAYKSGGTSATFTDDGTTYTVEDLIDAEYTMYTS